MARDIYAKTLTTLGMNLNKLHEETVKGQFKV